tara:strand:+ start:5272 stop:5667 length:396 start_codon:yes stop_codon:yes gene_type:complete
MDCLKFENSGVYTVIEGAEDFAQRLTDKYGKPFCSGRNRVVWSTGKHVIKVPRCWDGVADNDWEASVSCDIYPRTRYLLIPGTEIVICMMQKLNTHAIRYVRELPSWVNSVDCGQVGMLKGRILAFDYGYR